MKRKLTFVILMLTAISVSGYADDVPVLATAGFVRDAYNQINAKKQDKLPMASRPTSGRYNVVWDADNGKFIFTEIGTCVEETGGLQCDANAGLYDIGINQCVDVKGSGSNNGYNTEEWTWWTKFGYATITGVATCLSGLEGLNRIDTRGSYFGTGEYSNTFIADVPAGLSGFDSLGAERKYCWCKMTYPAVSKWVFSVGVRSADECMSLCANDCSITRAYADLRLGLYKTVEH